MIIFIKLDLLSTDVMPVKTGIHPDVFPAEAGNQFK